MFLLTLTLLIIIIGYIVIFHSLVNEDTYNQYKALYFFIFNLIYFISILISNKLDEKIKKRFKFIDKISIIYSKRNIILFLLILLFNIIVILFNNEQGSLLLRLFILINTIFYIYLVIYSYKNNK